MARPLASGLLAAIVSSAVLLHSQTTAHSSQQETRPAKERMVIVISLDGFPANALNDPKLPIPTLRQLIQDGSWAKRMQPVNPTVTWPNHTTMVTGLFPRDHGLLFNGTLVRTENPLSAKVDPSVPKAQMVHCKTLYDVAHENGLTTAQVDWVAINQAKSIDWAFPERAKASDPLVAEMISKGVIQASDVGNEGNPTILWRDQIWTRAASYIVREHKPNLLLFHLLSLDATQHSYGPGSLASYDAIAFLDSCVARLIETVKAAGLLDRTTFLVVSDHGFKAVQKQIRLKNLLSKAQLSSEVTAVPEGGSAMIYVQKDQRNELLSKVRRLFQDCEGVDSVKGEEEIRALGLPAPAQDAQTPDLIAYAKGGYAFAGGKEGDALIEASPQPTGSHGYLNDDAELDAIFIAFGYGIRPHVAVDKIRNLAVAPTLARLLDVRLPKQEGNALDSMLQ